MLTKPVAVLVGWVGFLFMLQTTPAATSSKHMHTLMDVFRDIRFDLAKEPLYLSRARAGMQAQFRDPLMKHAQQLPESAELSSQCLKRMVAEVGDLDELFYATFGYGCQEHDQYSLECLEAAEPDFLSGLQALVRETQKCWVKTKGGNK
ncbi:uncharacterized protein LOC128725998 [Anopheles nili]|uniref:uncharacterized protein LOC128725998 n=1 Tax=Anopheles nili TaxID=185578 RepID=UPI00237A7E7C|nr:uncharacterized protein LOC128725998 [Anopheles nili]